MENNLRGVFAEYLVAEVLGSGWQVKRGSWNEWDIDGPSGARLEVKSASYLQTWTQAWSERTGYKPKPPQFGIAAHKYDFWLQPYPELKRPAHAYVFALHAEQNPDVADQRKLAQWRFFVVASRDLPPKQKTISFGALVKRAELIAAHELKAEVARVLAGVLK